MSAAGPAVSDKIRYLDGLRGVAAIGVVLAHLINGFYPALYTGDPRQAHNAWEVWAAGSPFNMVAIGNCFVCIFFILSGYVLTHAVLAKNRAGQFPALAAARYMRLTLPILAAGMLTWAMLRLGLAANEAASVKSNSYWWLAGLYQFEPSFTDALSESVFHVYRWQTDYNPVLWTMRIELLGSFMVFAILALCRTRTSRLAAGLAVPVFYFDVYYFCFIVGMVLHDARDGVARAHAENRGAGKWITLLLLATGLFLGAYPLAYTDGTWYAGLAGWLAPRFGDKANVMAHFAGAILLMLAVERSASIRKLLCGKVLQFAGRNAYSIYLLHLILIASVFSAMFNLLSTWLPYNAACLGAAIVYVAVLALSSQAMYYAVDRPSVRLGHIVVEAIAAVQQRARRKAAALWAAWLLRAGKRA